MLIIRLNAQNREGFENLFQHRGLATPHVFLFRHLKLARVILPALKDVGLLLASEAEMLNHRFGTRKDGSWAATRLL